MDHLLYHVIVSDYEEEMHEYKIVPSMLLSQHKSLASSKCNDTHRIRRKNNHQRYRHHVCCSSYVLCSSARYFLRGLTQAHHTFVLHSGNCPSQQSWVTVHALLGEVGLISIHTDFQALGRLASISYLETDNGQKAENRWTMTVKSKRISSSS